jgi:hypothetical protein
MIMFVSVPALAEGDKKWTPPQAAFDACAKAKQADKCSFKGRHDRQLQGTCEVPRDGGKALVCRPARKPGAGSGSGDGSAKP